MFPRNGSPGVWGAIGGTAAEYWNELQVLAPDGRTADRRPPTPRQHVRFATFLLERYDKWGGTLTDLKDAVVNGAGFLQGGHFRQVFDRLRELGALAVDEGGRPVIRDRSILERISEGSMSTERNKGISSNSAKGKSG